MTSKMLYLFLDAMTCALGAVLVIFLTELNQSRDSIEQLQGTLAKHDADMQMVAKLHGERDHAVRRGDRLAESLGNSQTMLALAQTSQKKVAKDNALLRADLKTAISNNKVQAANLQQSNDDRRRVAADLKGSQHNVAQLTSENQRLVLRNQVLGHLQQTQAREVIGLKGKFTHTVFVFDTSRSMAPGFDEHKALLSTWIQRLQFDQFNLIQFSDTATRWHPSWKDSSSLHRKLAKAHIDEFTAIGNTATKQALSNALALPDIDTIVFFSDGAPSDATHEEILKHIRKINRQSVVINVVALGNYFEADYGSFLKQLVDDHGGQFIGR